MWKIKELKEAARQVVKKNYWTAIVVCFIIALFTGEFGTSIIGVWRSGDSLDPHYVIHSQEIINSDRSNEQKVIEARKKVEEIDKKIEDKVTNLNDTELKIVEAVESNLSSITKNQKYLLKIWDAIQSFNINQVGLGIEFSVTAVITVVFTIVISNPLIVAGKKYFLKARKEENKISVMLEIFGRGSWINVAITMFLRTIYNFLWYLTIIGGFIKTYEYKMIPYILAENPKINRKEAFKLSREMMRGNKWKAFLLDLSFIGWNIVSVFTLGLLNLLYTNPYKSATVAELYMTLREKAIKEEYEYYEDLNDETL